MAKWKAHVSRTFPGRDGEGRACRAHVPPDDGRDKRVPPDDGRDKRVPPDDGRDKRIPPDGRDKRVPPDDGRDKRVPPNGRDGEGRACRARISPLWQRGCWDVQLRQGENFAAKCEYMRDNPVRADLVANVGEWPYQGRLNNLMWHDKV